MTMFTCMLPFAEIHVMEHGLYELEGKAVYPLNKYWVELEAGDYMWLRVFCPMRTGKIGC